jgi:DNA polymerase-1
MLLLIDSHAILHRAYHALPKESLSQKGQPINAVYGFFSMLLAGLDQLQPDYLIACFDAPGPTFRHQQFIGYQANRPRTEEELKPQLAITRQALKDANIPALMAQGYEADDIIGTILKKLQSSNAKKFKNVKKSIIVTGDKDLMQLVETGSQLFLLVSGMTGGKLVSQEEVDDILGVKPEQVIDYKALVGDPSDNYPGVYGIGPKTAIKLLAKYQDLDTIYKHLDELKGSLKKKLIKGKDSAYLSYELARINKQAPVKLDLKKAKWSDAKLLELKRSLAELNFRSLVSRIEKKFNQGKTDMQMELI